MQNATTTRAKKEAPTPEPTEVEVTRTIAAEDEIWSPDEVDEATGAKRPSLLSLEEQNGIVELELTRPLKLSDREEPYTHLQIQAPNMNDISKTQGNIRQLISKCVIGINPRDLEGLHGRDYVRLQGLIRHFLA